MNTVGRGISSRNAAMKADVERACYLWLVFQPHPSRSASDKRARALSQISISDQELGSVRREGGESRERVAVEDRDASPTHQYTLFTLTYRI
jgi:hypothetical protein